MSARAFRFSLRAPHVWRRAEEHERVPPFRKCTQTTRVYYSGARDGRGWPYRTALREGERVKEEAGIAYYRMCAMNASRLKSSLEVFRVVVWQRGGKNASFSFLFRVLGAPITPRGASRGPIHVNYRLWNKLG